MPIPPQSVNLNPEHALQILGQFTHQTRLQDVIQFSSLTLKDSENVIVKSVTILKNQILSSQTAKPFEIAIQGAYLALRLCSTDASKIVKHELDDAISGKMDPSLITFV